MYKYEVGQTIYSFKGVPEGVNFDMTDAGADLLIFFNKPNKSEIEDIKKGKLQFGMFTKENIIFILSKFGSMNWMDSPYHVALSKNLTKLDEVRDGEGYGCSIVLVDCSTGEIKVLRYISFNTLFSRKLKSNIEQQMYQSFNTIKCNNKINDIMTNYTTNDMVKYSEVNCIIR